uniref:Uncharacterized protein n=1 Tax=Arundo donax TaxID=35708 RepID=A0A0A9AS19_ARUDO
MDVCKFILLDLSLKIFA